jgi:hypothetical protein
VEGKSIVPPDPNPFAWTPDIDVVGTLLSPAILLVLGGFALWVWISLRADRGFGSVPGGLNYVTGPMGSGKSIFGVKEIVKALSEGKYVITNVELLPGWSEKVAAKRYPKRKRDAGRAMIEGLYVYETSLRRAMRYRVPCARCGEPVKVCGHSGAYQEARAIFVWDETHNDLNNRDYQGHGSTREERDSERERRRLVIRWATQLRKLGFVGYLLSQHHENTDAQLRRVCNHLIMLQNQRNRGGFGMLLPRRLARFLVYWYPAHLADGTTRVPSVKRDAYFLPWERILYDSWATYHGIDDLQDDDSPIQLLGKKQLLSAVPGAPASAGGGAATPTP